MAADSGTKQPGRLALYMQKFDALQPRERVLVAIMLLALVFVLLNSLLLDPARKKQQILTKDMQAQQDGLQMMTAQIAALHATEQQDPDQPLRARLEQLKQQGQQLRGEIETLQRGVVQPERMPQLLETMLQKQGGLDLVALKTLSVEPVGEPTTPAASQPGVTPPALLYRHAVQIEVRGSYFDLQRYLQALESSPWQLFWQRVELKTDEYPQVDMKLTVQTFSFDPTWLSFGKD